MITKFLFSVACSATSGQALDHWNITGGQFGWDFITVVMKSNCNKNETQNPASKGSFSSVHLLSISISQVIFFFPVSLNGLNYLIIFNSSSQLSEVLSCRVYHLMESVVFPSCMVSTGYRLRRIDSEGAITLEPHTPCGDAAYSMTRH